MISDSVAEVVMKKADCCSTSTMSSHDKPASTSQLVQPFPTTGVLVRNLNLPLAILRGRIRNNEGRVYSYVVRTVKMKSNTLGFEQHGSAPNFQGDILTLCTCKHQMRSRLSSEQWQNDVWIAGVTSRTIHDGRHWLFYLAKVESAHDSQSDLWSSMDAATRNAKAAHIHIHFLGDIFKPKTPQPTGNARFSPSRYVMPSVHAHRTKRNPNGWHNDIHYHLSSKTRHPPLLVADPKRTFLWNEPMISFAEDHCRDYFKWSSVQELIVKLREAM
jgi:hypothetical protein